MSLSLVSRELGHFCVFVFMFGADMTYLVIFLWVVRTKVWTNFLGGQTLEGDSVGGQIIDYHMAQLVR